MKIPKVSLLRILVHLGAWIPLAWLVWDYFAGNLTVNPIQDMTQRTGKYALVLVVLSLACTPLNTLFGFRQALTVRRALGLYGFMYAALHFSIFIVLDYGLDWTLIPEAVFEKPYIVVGLSALVILTSLAVTSFKWWMKRLGKNWKRLHRLVYLAAGLVIVHFAWASKGDLLRLQGEIQEPLYYGLAVALLLVARLSPMRQFATRLRTTARGLFSQGKITQNRPGSERPRKGTRAEREDETKAAKYIRG
jgi:sulfoxide reductase heme-binding subunit YedZ